MIMEFLHMHMHSYQLYCPMDNRSRRNREKKRGTQVNRRQEWGVVISQPRRMWRDKKNWAGGCGKSRGECNEICTCGGRERERGRKREERSERYFGPWQQRHRANQISPTGKTPELVVEHGEIGRHHRRKILSKIFFFFFVLFSSLPSL